jgi:hypothetical protein
MKEIISRKEIGHLNNGKRERGGERVNNDGQQTGNE